MISPRFESMTRTKRGGTAVRLSKETHAILRKVVKHTGKTQDDIMHTLIEMADFHDLLNEGWQDRLTAALEKGMWHIAQQKHFENKKRCSGLRSADRKWKCIQGRYQNVPSIKILAEDYDDALNLCEGCEVTLEPILKNYELQEKILTLEQKIKARVNVSFKAPICQKGAVLTADGTEFRSCPKTTEKTVSVKTWCQKYSRGQPCALYGEVVIAVADKASKHKMDL